MPDILFICGYCGGVNCGWRQLLPDGQLSAGENLAAGHGTGSGVTGQGADPKADPLNEEEMSRPRWGCVLNCKNPGDIEGWIMLGRVGMALGNASIATDAYATAYRLDPKNSDAALGYAEALTRSSDPNDNRLGGELLRQLVRTDHSNIRVLSMYAFNAFEQQRFGEAVAAWEMMLKLLPANDTRRAVIERSIAQAMQHLSPQESK